MEVSLKNIALVATILCISLSSVVAKEEQEGSEQVREESEKVRDEAKKEKWFVASYYTTTYTALSVVTSARPYFCIQASNAQACTGRRSLRRKRRLNIQEGISKDGPINLDVSEDAGTPSKASPDTVGTEGQDGSGKFFFTVWRSTTSTITITSLSTLTNITISVSARCTHNGFTSIPVCG